jgi:uncharacterized membrane protein YfcA
MNDDDDTLARNRWFAMVAVRLAATAGAVLGLILVARAQDGVSKGIGIALVLASLYMMAVIPRALAARWRTPPPA